MSGAMIWDRIRIIILIIIDKLSLSFLISVSVFITLFIEYMSVYVFVDNV